MTVWDLLLGASLNIRGKRKTDAIFIISSPGRVSSTFHFGHECGQKTQVEAREDLRGKSVRLASGKSVIPGTAPSCPVSDTIIKYV